MKGKDKPVKSLRTGVLAAIGLALAAPASANERDDAIGTVGSLVAAWRTAEPAKAMAVLDPAFRLIVMQGDGPARAVSQLDRNQYLAEMKGLRPGQWRQEIDNPQIEVDLSGLTVLTSRYVVRVGGKPERCGVTSFQLFKVNGQWRIMAMAETRNATRGREPSEVCPFPWRGKPRRRG